jgi:hypothetical protein
MEELSLNDCTSKVDVWENRIAWEKIPLIGAGLAILHPADQDSAM